MKIRTFIALRLASDAIDSLLKLRDDFFPAEKYDLNWEKREKLHLTLKFLGDTDENLIPDISRAIADILKEKEKPKLRFSRFGLFFRDNKPRILYAGLEKNETLISIAGEINENLIEFGFKKETRNFKAHLTLLRIKNGKYFTKIKQFTKVKPPGGIVSVDSIVFYSSELNPGGSIYKAIEKFNLD